jgi:two-component system, sensor histidine kinase and response regulator
METQDFAQHPESEQIEKISILLVDDQPGKLLSHQVLLRDLGAEVVTAESGLKALECLLHTDFAVILLDVQMPQMDGFETAALIRQRPRFEHTPIIFVTGYSTNDMDRLKGYDIGAADYLFLPIIPEVLRAKVRVFVELARQRMIIEKQAQRLAVHSRKQDEQIETIQKLNERLKIANADLESFCYSVSHDLRAPLRAIQNYSNILLEECVAKIDEEGQRCLNRIVKSARHLDNLVHDILSYSQHSRGDLQNQKVQLDQVVNAVIEQNPALQPTRVELSIQGPLPEVCANESSLIQCFSNLLSNAAKFVPAGIKPTVKVRSESCDESVRIWIEDNGIGIDPAYHDKIFGVFERIPNESMDYPGTGIGLAIVRKAVERMGGKVGVVSQLGRGSRFWMEFQKIHAHQDGSPPLEEPQTNSRISRSHIDDGGTRHSSSPANLQSSAA